MTRVNKEVFLEYLCKTKDASTTRFITDVEIWQYYELRWEDQEFAKKCDKILGFKDKLTLKNLRKEMLKGNFNAMMIARHILDHNDLFTKLYDDHNIEPFGIDNMKDLLDAQAKVLSLADEGKLSIDGVSEILDVLEERRMEILFH